MEPHRGFGNRQVLLPHEVAVCQSLGISKEEYFEFFDLLTQERQKRSAEYDHIPDVRNDPVTIAVNLVIGIALTAVSALLAPKPKSPEQKEQNNFQGTDVKGRTKFSPLRQFDSVQDLATLSSIVPLVYTRWTPDHGGVRVESQLLWSQMRNRKTYQTLKAIMMFSGGRIEQRPDFDSYAFGSQKIGGYSRNKIEMVFKTGGRDQGPAILNSADQYREGTYIDKLAGQSEDTQNMFDSYYINDQQFKSIFCSVHTPTTSAQFGQYQPMANGTSYRYAFDAPGKGDGESGETKNQIFAKRQKHIGGYFSREAFIDQRSGDTYDYVLSSQGSIYCYLIDGLYEGDVDLNHENHWDDSEDKFLLKIVSTPENGSNWAEDSGNFGSAINACDQSRIDADVSIEVGDLFLLGDEIVRCSNKSGQVPWEVVQGSRTEKRYTLETVEEYGSYDKADGGSSKTTRIDTYQGSKGLRQIARTDLAYPLQRVAIGAVSTTRAVDMVEIGIKSTVWRQCNGYPNVTEFLGFGQVNRYAKDGSTFQLGSQQVYHERLSFFRVEYRKTGVDQAWSDISPEAPFAVYGNNPAGVYNMIRISHSERNEFEYRFIPISGNVFCELGEWATPKDIEINLLQEDAPWRGAGGRHGPSASDIASFKGIKKRLDTRLSNSLCYAIGDFDQTDKGTYGLERNQNPNSALCDYYTFDAEDSSHRNAPEHEITWINEFVDNKDSWYANPKDQYSRIAYAGLMLASSKEYSNFSELSAYFKRGIQMPRLINASGSFDSPELNFAGVPETATCLFPEVAYDLLSNKFRGAGELVGRGEVHDGKMKLAARYCQANNFYWDGVISQKVNLRQFIFEQAAYCMLDFTIVGGMFALVPSLPYNADFSINEAANVNDGTLPIAALFTDGNMRNYKVTFLSPEERQNFIAEVKYREENENGFPTEQSFRLRIAKLENDSRNEGTFNDPIETFDMTQFCTKKEHAVKFAKYALRTRQFVDHALEFETTPDAAAALEPGAYIRVASEVTHHYNNGARFSVGSIDSTGVVQSGQSDIDGKEIFYWKPGMDGVRSAILDIDNNRAVDSGLRGTVFSVKPNGVEPRLYKVESISLSEDGMVDISATHAPTNPFGQLKVLQWDDSGFVEEE